MVFNFPDCSFVLGTGSELGTLLFLFYEFTYIFSSFLIIAQKLIMLCVGHTIALFIVGKSFSVQFLDHIINLSPISLILRHSIWSMLNCTNMRQITRKLIWTRGAVLILRNWLLNQTQAIFLYLNFLVASVNLLFRLFNFVRVTFLMIFIALKQMIINKLRFLRILLTFRSNTHENKGLVYLSASFERFQTTSEIFFTKPIQIEGF